MLRLRTIAAGVALALAGAGLGAPAGSTVPLTGQDWVGSPNGLVGVQQTVIVRAPRLAGQVATISFANPATGTNSGQAAVNSAGFAYLPWTPNLPGAWTITATSGAATIDSANVLVSAMPTATTLLMPGEVERNRTISVAAEVQALAGNSAPSGTVSVTNQFGNEVATGTLQPTATPGLASANISWTPAPGSFRFNATYTPNSSAFLPSTSPGQTPIIGDAQPVSLSMPPVLYVGVPATVSAVINPQFQQAQGGSVAFYLNTQGVISYPMGGSRPIASGVGSTSWTPTQSGFQTVGVSYSTANFSLSATDTQPIVVQPAPAPDAITVTATGGSVWAQGVVGTLRVGDYVELTPSARSGNPVTLSVDGPCAMEAGTLTVLGPGQCSVTAASIGNGSSLTATEATYVVEVQAVPRKRR